MNSKNTDYFAMEAIPEERFPLKLPNFHILAYRDESEVMVGKCLDFGIYAYSQQSDNEVALDHVFERLCDMVMLHIPAHLKNQSEAHLYDNGEISHGEWGTYQDKNNINKISKLKSSYAKLLKRAGDDPRKLKRELEKPSGLSTLDISKRVISTRYVFSTLCDITPKNCK